MSLIIRRAHPDDAPRLAALARARAATVTAEYVTAHPVFTASEGTRLVGFYALEDEGERWTLRHLWVAPEWTGRGRGRWMFTDAVRRVRRAHGAALRLVPERGAEAFFLKMGAAAGEGGVELDPASWEEPLPDSVSGAAFAE
ncbi:MAG TPA: GNAT family N-acetyltransferase [Longimicrobium sp.]|nr:GNAT family N-acetyltransferase [Longimicrobium sp.]